MCHAFRNKWISRDFSVACPPLPELFLASSHFNSFLCGAIKSFVYHMSANSEMDLLVESVLLRLQSMQQQKSSKLFDNPCRIEIMRLSMPMGAVSNGSFHGRLQIIHCTLFWVIKRFTLLSALRPYCVFVNLYPVKVAFPPIISYAFMVPNDIVNLPSKFEYEILRSPVYYKPYINIIIILFVNDITC